MFELKINQLADKSFPEMSFSRTKNHKLIFKILIFKFTFYFSTKPELENFKDK